MSRFGDEFRKEGRAEGIEENKKETALRMIRGRSLSDDEISEYSGLPVKEIRELRMQENAPS